MLAAHVTAPPAHVAMLASHVAMPAHQVSVLADHVTPRSTGTVPGMDTTLERLAEERFLLLTTFRRTGAPVATPVWACREGNEITVWTERNAGKVKRIRNNPRVELAACDLRGRNTHGDTVSGTARVLDEQASERVRRSLADKYGLIGRLTMFFSRLRGGTDRTVGLAIGIDS